MVRERNHRSKKEADILCSVVGVVSSALMMTMAHSRKAIILWGVLCAAHLIVLGKEVDEKLCS